MQMGQIRSLLGAPSEESLRGLVCGLHREKREAAAVEYPSKAAVGGYWPTRPHPDQNFLHILDLFIGEEARFSPPMQNKLLPEEPCVSVIY